MGSLLEQEEPPSVVAERDYLIAEREKSASVILTKRGRKRPEGAADRRREGREAALSPPRSRLVQLWRGRLPHPLSKARAPLSSFFLHPTGERWGLAFGRMDPRLVSFHECRKRCRFSYERPFAAAAGSAHAS